MNVKRNLVLALLFTALISLFGTTSTAHAGRRVSYGFRVGFAPPPPRHEVVVVRPRPGYYWVDGYWDWRPVYREYVWVPGYWARPPHPRAVWVAPRYTYRHHDRHHHYYRRGYWR